MIEKRPFIIGNLNIVRCFGMENTPYYGVSSNNDKRIYYSRQCEKGFMLHNPAKDVQKSFESLKSIVDEVGRGHYLLYSNDGHLQLISRYYDEIREMFTVALPDKKIIDASLDKEMFYNLCREYQLPIAPTFDHSQSFDVNDLKFPVVFKPLSRVGWFNSKIIKDLGGKSYKVIFAESRQEYEKFAKQFADEKIEYVVQQYIPGPESNVLSFHTFFSEDSEPLGYYCGRKIRTYPTDYGRSCFLRLIEHPEMVETSIDMLKRLKFVGPIKIDYKLDESDGKLYLLEFNPRYNLWNYLGAKSGVNLPYLAYRYYTGKLNGDIPKKDYQTSVKWININQDFLAYRELSAQKKMTFRQWLASIRGKKVLQTFAINDLGPFFYTVGDTLMGGFRKIKRMVSS